MGLIASTFCEAVSGARLWMDDRIGDLGVMNYLRDRREDFPGLLDTSQGKGLWEA